MNPRPTKKPPKPKGNYHQILTEHRRKQEVRNKQVQFEMDNALAKSKGRLAIKKKVKF